MHLPQDADTRRQPEITRASLETLALRAVPHDERREREALLSQDGAGVEEEVHALLQAQAAKHSDDGAPDTTSEGGEPFALGWGACRGGRQCGVVDDTNPAVAMPERPSLSLRHDHNALGRTEQPPVDPVVESVLAVFGCGTMKESHPGPPGAQSAQQIRHRRRLVAVGLDDRRSPAAQ